MFDKQLPIERYRQEIVRAADENDVLIVVGSTGSGKSSRVPQYLLETEHFRKHGMIMTTQPRRIAAISLAKRVSKELGEHGESMQRVGYAIGQDRRFSEAHADVVFVTSGWLVQKLVHQPQYAVEKISYLVVDESHERDVDMDLLCLLIRALMQRYPARFKLVLMSATFNADAFRNYFPGRTHTVNVNMQTYPVQTLHLDTLRHWSFMDDATIEAMQTEMRLSANRRRHDELNTVAGAVYLCHDVISKRMEESSTVLVFCSGMQEIDDMYEQLSALDEQQVRMHLYTLHSSMEKEQQMQAFEPHDRDTYPHKVLRVVLATNIAESSVTLPNVQYVIDLGKHKVMRYDERDELMKLECTWVSRASAQQRAGRTGRVCPGTVVRMYTQRQYLNMQAYDLSEVHMVPLEQTLLRLYMLKANGTQIDALQDPIQCMRELIDPPSLEAIQVAHAALLDMGALVRDRDAMEEQDEADELVFDELDFAPEHIDERSARSLELEAELERLFERTQTLEREVRAIESNAPWIDEQAANMREIMEYQHRQNEYEEKYGARLKEFEAQREVLGNEMRELENHKRVCDENINYMRQQVERVRTELVNQSGVRTYVTTFGRLLSSMPLSLPHAKTVLFGAQTHTYAVHFAAIGAYMSCSDVYVMPNRQDENRERYQQLVRRVVESRRYFADKHRSELLGGVELLRELLSQNARSKEYGQWLYSHGLHRKRVRQFRSLFVKLVSCLADTGFQNAVDALPLLVGANSEHRALSFRDINKMLPTNRHHSASCSLLVALALHKNILEATVYPQDASAPSSELRLFVHSFDNYDQIRGDRRRFVTNMFSRQLAPCATDVDFCELADSPLQHPHQLRVRFNDDQLAAHVLTHYTIHEILDLSQTLHTRQPGRGARGEFQATSTKFRLQAKCQAPVDTLKWFVHRRESDHEHGGDAAVIDRSGRSPYYSLAPWNYYGFLDKTTADSCYMQNKNAFGSVYCRGMCTQGIFAVSPTLVRTGRNFRAQQLSLVPAELTVLYTLLLEYTTSEGESEQWMGMDGPAHGSEMSLMCVGPRKQLLMAQASLDRKQVQRLGQLQELCSTPLQRMLRTWTHDNLLCPQRARTLCDLLQRGIELCL